MNSFLSIRAGLFAATNSCTGKSPSMAELICAAICQNLSSDESKIFDSTSWLTAITNIPFQSLGNSSSQNTQVSNIPTSSQIASLCVSASNPALKSLQSEIAKLPIGISELNCLSIIEVSDKNLQIEFANVVIEYLKNETYSITTKTSSSTLSYSNAGTEKQLLSIFNDFAPPVSQSYYIVVPCSLK